MSQWRYSHTQRSNNPLAVDLLSICFRICCIFGRSEGFCCQQSSTKSHRLSDIDLFLLSLVGRFGRSPLMTRKMTEPSTRSENGDFPVQIWKSRGSKDNVNTHNTECNVRIPNLQTRTSKGVNVASQSSPGSLFRTVQFWCHPSNGACTIRWTHS